MRLINSFGIKTPLNRILNSINKAKLVQILLRFYQIFILQVDLLLEICV